MRYALNRLILVLAVVAVAGCDFLDPTEITNPTVTEDDFTNLPNAARTWAHGTERQLAITVNTLTVHAEVASDNMFNNRTLINRTFDIPQMDPTDASVVAMQREVQRLRAMANDGLNVVIPADPDATDEHRARMHFYRGFAHMAAGEYFVALPAEGNGPAEAPGVHMASALQDLQQAVSLSSDATLQNSARLFIARIHYRQGNLSEAVSTAEQVRGSAPMLLRQVQYDQADGPTNTLQFALYDSGQDEFQPLPRLDFLFPKYWSVSAVDQSPINIAKGEEAFLIVAEAQIAQGNLGGARSTLIELLGVVAQRPTAMVLDNAQARGRTGGTWIYPNRSEVLVAASPDDEPRAGLVLDRQSGPVEVPYISGTSVTETMIDAAGSEEELLEVLYLLRQEIFVGEGRRMVDLGIRIGIALEEAEANPNIDTGSNLLQARIPSWIPGNYGMNSFDYQDGDPVAVIHHNLTREIVQNRTSDMVLPFH
ncbi:MAG: hypothetical protein EA351_12555 [Gemmatimonadales bacterium]|nr:MAG: hypothetical protein EA351_12555 [Gemmatimonadales bacterium]